jgi:DNA processing protein
MERAFWLAWSQIPGIGPILLKRLYLHFGKLSTAWRADAEALAEVEGIGRQSAAALISARTQLNVDDLLETYERQNRHFLTPDDDLYPRLLFEIPDPPPVLHYRGQVDLIRSLETIPAIALVGTRHPSDYGRRWTRKLSSALAQRGFVVMSGLADGIDAEAHRSCLETKGQTIAVLGTGVDVVYPAKNRQLYTQVLETGLAFSEYPAGTQPDRSHFPRRNRIVAGLSRAVLVIEAPIKSGALITAHLANDYGRDVYALPGSLDNDKAKGCLGLISKGAQMILGEAELLEMLGTLPILDQSHPHHQYLDHDGKPSEAMQLPLLNLSTDLSHVLQSIHAIGQGHSQTTATFDAIVQHTGMETASVSSALLQLELLGLIEQLPGMSYQMR